MSNYNLTTAEQTSMTKNKCTQGSILGLSFCQPRIGNQQAHNTLYYNTWWASRGAHFGEGLANAWVQVVVHNIICMLVMPWLILVLTSCPHGYNVLFRRSSFRNQWHCHHHPIDSPGSESRSENTRCSNFLDENSKLIELEHYGIFKIKV